MSRIATQARSSANESGMTLEDVVRRINEIDAIENRTEADNDELRTLKSEKNRFAQKAEANAAREALIPFARIREDNPYAKVARRVVQTLMKDAIKNVVDANKEVKRDSELPQIQAFCEQLASEDSLQDFKDKVVTMIVDVMRASPRLATRSLILPGNILALDVLKSTTGVRTSTGAIDLDVNSAIALELAPKK